MIGEELHNQAPPPAAAPSLGSSMESDAAHGGPTAVAESEQTALATMPGAAPQSVGEQQQAPGVETSLENNLTCAICTSADLLLDPVVAGRCGHVFCGDCLEKWRRSRGPEATCPNCRGALLNTAIPCLSLTNIIEAHFPEKQQRRQDERERRRVEAEERRRTQEASLFADLPAEAQRGFGPAVAAIAGIGLHNAWPPPTLPHLASPGPVLLPPGTHLVAVPTNRAQTLHPFASPPLAMASPAHANAGLFNLLHAHSWTHAEPAWGMFATHRSAPLNQAPTDPTHPAPATHAPLSADDLASGPMMPPPSRTVSTAPSPNPATLHAYLGSMHVPPHRHSTPGSMHLPPTYPIRRQPTSSNLPQASPAPQPVHATLAAGQATPVSQLVPSILATPPGGEPPPRHPDPSTGGMRGEGPELMDSADEARPVPAESAGAASAGLPPISTGLRRTFHSRSVQDLRNPGVGNAPGREQERVSGLTAPASGSEAPMEVDVGEEDTGSAVGRAVGLHRTQSMGGTPASRHVGSLGMAAGETRFTAAIKRMREEGKGGPSGGPPCKSAMRTLQFVQGAPGPAGQQACAAASGSGVAAASSATAPTLGAIPPPPSFTPMFAVSGSVVALNRSSLSDVGADGTGLMSCFPHTLQPVREENPTAPAAAAPPAPDVSTLPRPESLPDVRSLSLEGNRAGTEDAAMEAVEGVNVTQARPSNTQGPSASRPFSNPLNCPLTGMPAPPPRSVTATPNAVNVAFAATPAAPPRATPPANAFALPRGLHPMRTTAASPSPVQYPGILSVAASPAPVRTAPRRAVSSLVAYSANAPTASLGNRATTAYTPRGMPPPASPFAADDPGTPRAQQIMPISDFTPSRTDVIGTRNSIIEDQAAVQSVSQRTGILAAQGFPPPASNFTTLAPLLRGMSLDAAAFPGTASLFAALSAGPPQGLQLPAATVPERSQAAVANSLAPREPQPWHERGDDRLRGACNSAVFRLFMERYDALLSGMPHSMIFKYVSSLEEHLYFTSPTKAQYADLATLPARMEEAVEQLAAASRH